MAASRSEFLFSADKREIAMKNREYPAYKRASVSRGDKARRASESWAMVAYWPSSQRSLIDTIEPVFSMRRLKRFAPRYRP